MHRHSAVVFHLDAQRDAHGRAGQAGDDLDEVAAIVALPSDGRWHGGERAGRRLQIARAGGLGVDAEIVERAAADREARLGGGEVECDLAVAIGAGKGVLAREVAEGVERGGRGVAAVLQAARVGEQRGGPQSASTSGATPFVAVWCGVLAKKYGPAFRTAVRSATMLASSPGTSGRRTACRR